MKLLKYLFIFGFILALSSLVIPYSKTGDSRIENIRYDADGDIPLLLFYIFWYGLHLAFIFLTIQHPKRWVFLSGSILAVLALLAIPISYDLDANELPDLMYIFGYALVLTGYFIKPPKSSPNPAVDADSS